MTEADIEVLAYAIRFYSFFFRFPYPAAEIAPFQKWKVITTKYFDIIFCERSKTGLPRISQAFADRTYEKVVGLLKGIDRHRITVVISPDYEAANGFSIPVPYNTMMLYDYPAEFDGSIGNYRDALYDLFIHETDTRHIV